MKKLIFFFMKIVLFERYGCVDSISGLYAVKRCHLQEGIAGECEKLGNVAVTTTYTMAASYAPHVDMCAPCAPRVRPTPGAYAPRGMHTRAPE